MAAGTNHIAGPLSGPTLITGPPAICLISGTVFLPDGTPLKNGTVQFNSVVEQTLLGGAVIPPTLVTTITDANGALIPVSIIQGLQGQFVFGSPAAGGCGDPTPVIIPIAPTADISSIMVGIQLATGTTTTFTALSVTGDTAMAGKLTVGGATTLNGTVTANAPVILNNTFQVSGTMFFPDGSTYTTAGHNTMKALGIGVTAPTVNPNALLLNNLATPTVLWGTEAQPNATLQVPSVYNLNVGAGSHYNGSNWIADNTFATILTLNGGNATAGIFINGGLTAGASYAPTEIAHFNANGLTILPPGASQLRFGSSTSPTAAIQAGGGNANLSGGSYFNGSQWIATNTGAALVVSAGAASPPGVQFYANSGLTAGNPFTQALICYVNTAGFTVAVGTLTSPNLHITGSVQFDAGATITGTITTNTVNMNTLGVTNNATISGTATIGVCNMNSGGSGGNFTVNGTLSVPNNITCGALTTNIWYTTSSGVYEQWTGSIWQFVSGGAARFTIDTAGSLVAGGNVTVGASLQVNGQIMYFGGLGTGYYFNRNSSNGTWSIVEGGAQIFSLTASGVAGFGNGIYTAGNIQTTNGSFITVNGQALVNATYWYPNGVGGGWQQGWQPGIGNWVWTYSGSGAFWVLRASDGVCYAGTNAVGGIGAYQNLSDARAKLNITPEERGLEIVQQLKPIAFIRPDLVVETPNGGGDTKVQTKHIVRRRELGFSAQDLQPLLPEAVVPMGIELPDGSGGLDSDSPTLGIQETMLLPILVNAIKELAHRVEQLEAKGGPS